MTEEFKLKLCPFCGTTTPNIFVIEEIEFHTRDVMR